VKMAPQNNFKPLNPEVEKKNNEVVETRIPNETGLSRYSELKLSLHHYSLQ
jgi:hypothetical protein